MVFIFKGFYLVNAIILVILSSVLFFYAFAKNKNTISSFVIFLYFIVVVLSVPTAIVFNKPDYYVGDLSGGGVYFGLLLCLLLLPFLIVKEQSIMIVKLPNDRWLNILNFISIVLSFISIFYFFNVCLKVIFYDNLSGIRYELLSGGHPFISPGIINTMSGLSATFFTVPVFLFYISVIKNERKFVSSLLFLSSLSYPLFVFAYFGRDGFLFWVMAHICACLLFQDFFSLGFGKKLRIAIILFGCVGLSFFMFITFTRFGDFSESMLSILNYAGQAPINFIELFKIEVTPTYGAYEFNLIFRFFSDSDTASQFIYQLGDNVELSWVFGTMLKNMYIDFGFLGAILFLTTLSLIIAISFMNDISVIRMPKLFFFYCYSQIVIQGVFYFRQYNDAGNFYILILILVAILGMFIPLPQEIKKVDTENKI